MAWKIEYAETARRQLSKLDKPIARRILDYMDRRIAPLKDPRSVGKVLHGVLGDLWRYRVGEFRVICEIRDGEMRVLIVRVGNRKDVYR